MVIGVFVLAIVVDFANIQTIDGILRTWHVMCLGIIYKLIKVDQITESSCPDDTSVYQLLDLLAHARVFHVVL